MSRILFGHMSWSRMFVPHDSLLDSVIRGTVTYIGLFAILRLVRNRSVGGLGVSDLLLVILVANALQNGLIGKGSSLTEGAVSALTVFFWAHVTDWLAFRFPRLRRLVHSRPVAVIRAGRVLPEGLRREMLTREALEAQLRINGVADPGAVREAFVEENGQLSVVLEETQADGGDAGRTR